MSTKQTANAKIFNKQIDIAVIIPVYNCKKHLKDAVNSVLNQPYQKIFVVLVDDGSTDGSELICNELSEKNSKVTVIHKKNGGVSSARNAGIEHILERFKDDGQNLYITFLDADDCWTEGFFTDKSIAELPYADMIRFRSVTCNYSLNKSERLRDMEEGSFSGGTQIVRKCLLGHFGAALYASSFFNEKGVRFIDGLKYSENVLFLRTCAYKAASVALSNRILYLYRNNPTSCVHTMKISGFVYFEPMFKAYLENDFNGSEFVSWYLVDAIEDHLKFGGTVKEAKTWLSKHPQYTSVAKEYGGDRVANAMNSLNNSPYLYALKLRIKGIAFQAARKLIHIPPFSSIFDVIRYRDRIPKY